MRNTPKTKSNSRIKKQAQKSAITESTSANFSSRVLTEYALPLIRLVEAKLVSLQHRIDAPRQA